MKERLLAALGITSCAGAGCVGLIGLLSVSIAFAALAFMIAAHVVHVFFDAVPALSYWQSVLLVVGLWAIGLALRVGLFLLGILR